MSIRAHEDALFERWSAARASFNPDGIINEASYVEAPVRLLLIMKEVNDDKRKNFDLRDFLAKGDRPPTWDNVTRWVEGVQHVVGGGLLPRWMDFEHIDVARRSAALRQICVVNLKKAAGSHTTDNRKLKAAAHGDAVFLKEQLALYRADLTICCGSEVTKAVLRRDLLSLSSESSTRHGVRYFDGDQHGVVLDFCHPAARISPNFPFFVLVQAVAELRENGLLGTSAS